MRPVCLRRLSPVVFFCFLCGAGSCGSPLEPRVEVAGESGGINKVGITIGSVADLPSFNMADYYETGSADAGLISGGFCKEFCYLKQSLMETVRHGMEFEHLLGLIRSVHKKHPDFDFGDGDDNYYEIVPGFRIRLRREEESYLIQICEGGELHQEIILENDPANGRVEGTATNRFRFDECEDQGQTKIFANCRAESLGDPDCVVKFHSRHNGCFGSGTINFDVLGGSPRSYNLEANFSFGGIGAGDSGSLDLCLSGDWGAAGLGCFKAESRGRYPAIRGSQVPFIRMPDGRLLPGCSEAVANATTLCPNPKFDRKEFDVENPVCPFVKISASTCPVDFENVECCAMEGDTIASQTGRRIDPAGASHLFVEVFRRRCPVKEDSVEFVLGWDCEAEPGRDFILLDVSDEDLHRNLELQPQDHCETQGILQDSESLQKELSE